MAKKIVSQDIIQDGLFEPTIQDALKLEGVLKSLLTTMKDVAVSSKSAFTGGTNSYESLERTNKAYTDVVPMSKEFAKMQSQIISLQERLSLLTQGHADELVRLQQQYSSLLLAKKNEIGATNELLGSYANLDRQYKQNVKTLKDLYVAGKQSTEGFKQLQAEVQNAATTLKKADEAAGQFGRNVGNYEMATHKYRYSLFQVQQVMRELPNFAMSARVGFMALSNNLPILADELKKVANSVDEVTGKKLGWMKTMKMVAGELLGFQTLLLVGITLVVQYADQIGQWAVALFKGNEALIALKSNAETNAYAMDKASNAYQDATSKVMELINQIKLAKEGFMDKNTVLDTYNETIGKTLGQVTSLEEAEKRLIAQAPDYVSMLMYKAAAEEASKEGAKRTYEIQKDIMELENSSLYQQYKSMSKEDLSKLANSQQEGAKQRAISLYNAAAELRSLESQLKTEQTSFSELNLRLQRMAAEMAEKYGWNIKPWTKEEVSNLFGGKDGKDKKTNSSIGTKATKKNEEFNPLLEMTKFINEQLQIELKEAERNSNNLKKTTAKTKNDLIKIETDYTFEVINLQIRALQAKIEAYRATKGLDTKQQKELADMVLQVELLQSKLGRADIVDIKDGKPEKTSGTATTNTKLNNAQQTVKSLMDIYGMYDQYLASREKNEQSRLGREIQRTNSRIKELQLLSAQGVQTASDSIAYEERKEKELERKQDQIAKRQQRRQLATSAIGAFNSQIQAGKSPQQALLMTGAEMAALIAMISAFPTFYEGTEEGTIADKLGKPHLKGKDGYMIRVDGAEKVFKPEHTAMIGDMKNSEVAQLAYLHRTGYNPINVDSANQKGNPIIKELSEVKKAIQNQKPAEAFFSDTEKAMVRIIHTQDRVTKEIHKVGGIFGGR